MDLTRRPFGAEIGIMGWPYPGHGGSLWKELLLSAGWKPNLPFDDDWRAVLKAWEEELESAKADVLSALAEAYPITARWANSIEWLQERGRGDVVGIMSLHTGVVTTHTCLAWREDWRDEGGHLCGWGWVLAAPGDNGLAETHVDASGALMDRRGNHTNRVLVRPAIGEAEQRAIAEAWHTSIGDKLAGRGPIVTYPVSSGATIDADAFSAECRRILDDPDYIPPRQ